MTDLPAVAGVEQQDAAERAAAAPPGAAQITQFEQKDAAARTADQSQGGGGFMPNLEAGFTGAIRKLLGTNEEAPWYPKAAEIKPPLSRTPENTTANGFLEHVARGAGAALPLAATGFGEGAALDVLGSIAGAAGAGAGSGAGQYAGEHLTPAGYEGAGGLAGSVIGGLAGGAAGVGSASLAGRPFRPFTGAGQDASAAKILRESASDPDVTFQKAPIAGLPLDVAQSSNDPGLAAQVRLRNATDNSAAVQQRTAQNTALRESFTGANGQEPVLASGIDLSQSPEANAANASTRFLGSLQNANDIVRAEERRLWNVPELAGVKIDGGAVADTVAKGVSAMRPAFKREVEGGVIRPLLDEVSGLGSGATLDQLNAIRSDALADARAFRSRGRAVEAAAAEGFGSQMLKAIETSPQLAGRPATTRLMTKDEAAAAGQAKLGNVPVPAIPADPAAVAAYKTARAFTAQKWDALGFTPFQSLLRPNKFGNDAAVPETAAGKLFNFSAGAENVPGGTAGINSLLDEVRARWDSLGSLVHDPVTVNATKQDLGNSLRDYISAKALGASDSNVTDMAGQPGVIPNQLRAWIATNKGWLKRSGIFDQNQLGLLDRIEQASQMVSRTENLRGGSNSATYERLMGKTWVDGLAGKAFSRAAGAAVGAGMGYLTEGPIAAGAGAMLGARSGNDIMRSIYAAPRDGILKALDTAIRDPVIARDLMKQASPGTLRQMTPKTTDLLRSLAIYGASQSPQMQRDSP